MTAVNSSGAPSSVKKRNSFALGVDGGGTKTLAWVGVTREPGNFETIGKGNSGSSNQVAIGAELALENLASSVEQACSQAQISLDELNAGVFALAGSAHEAGRTRILEFVTERLQIPQVELVHDGQAVLEAGTSDGYGLALVAGTGAVAFGKNPAGETAVVGGWGYWFGDEGSAYWLGQQALRAISQAADSRAQATRLTERVLRLLDVEDPREILSALSRQGEVRSAIAGLAQLVGETAEANDDVATSIMDSAVQHWSSHLTTLAQRLDLTTSVEIALAGGVLCGSDLARKQLAAQLEQTLLRESSIRLVADPVEGCLKLACRKIWHSS